jgi:hypothetical protein
MPEAEQRSLLNQPSTPAERTREALASIADPKPEARLTTQPTRVVTNIYGCGIQAKF